MSKPHETMDGKRRTKDERRKTKDEGRRSCGPRPPVAGIAHRLLPIVYRRRSFAFCLLHFAFACLLTACATRTATTPSAPTLTGKLAISVAEQVQAGDPVQVIITRSDAPAAQPVTLLVQGSYGAQVYRGMFMDGTATIQLPGEALRASGWVSLIATAGYARGEATVEVRPGAPSDPITPLVGGRSVIADGKHWSMAVAVPFDSYGNPVADGSEVEFRTLHPDRRLEKNIVRSRNLIAWQRIYSSTRAGRSIVTVLAGDAHGPEASFQEVPGWPATFGLSASPENVPADGRQFVTLRTEVIRDQFGNQMLDGTLVTFAVETPDDEPRFIPAYTIDGVAEAQLQAPDQPGALTVRATMYGIESKPLKLSFAPGPAVGDVPVAAQVNARDGFVTIKAGPLLGTLDQFVPEATLVHFQLTRPDGTTQKLESTTETGYATITLRLAELAAGRYRVEVSAGAGSGETAFVVQ